MIFTTVVNTLMGLQVYRSDNFFSKSFKKSCSNIVQNRLYFGLRSLFPRKQGYEKIGGLQLIIRPHTNRVTERLTQTAEQYYSLIMPSN